MNLITKFQDEVHDTAISYHRKLRDESITKSELDDIKGIGEAKKKAFDGWDSWRYELLGKAVCLCDEKLAVKLEKLLDVFLEDIENDYTPEYKRQEDTILRYKLHRHLKGADAVKDELYACLLYTSPSPRDTR